MPSTEMTSLAKFTIRPGKTAEALRLIEAVKRQSEREQPGTLVYLVNHVLDKQNRPTGTLLFYERYRDLAALKAHLNASSWQAVHRAWKKVFEGAPPAPGRKVTPLASISEFARPGAIPSPARRRRVTAG